MQKKKITLTNHFHLKFCHNKNIGFGKKSESKKPNQDRSKE